ncbi:hypothetical protein [Aeromicrobium sp.]|uniref:hypothetical protein n=1 Tax=Aeromicrobium sp. TaxID=1871063 RepID=UPI002FC6776C
MTVPPLEPDPDVDIPGSEPEVPNPDVPGDPDDVGHLVPDGDLAAQNESAWPDDVDEGIVPDEDRVVPDLDEG